MYVSLLGSKYVLFSLFMSSGREKLLCLFNSSTSSLDHGFKYTDGRLQSSANLEPPDYLQNPDLPTYHNNQLKIRLTTQVLCSLKATATHIYFVKNFWLTKNILFGSDLQATMAFCYAAAMLLVSTVQLVTLSATAAAFSRTHGYVTMIEIRNLMMNKIYLKET